MADVNHEALKRGIGFDEQDATNLRALGTHIEPIRNELIDRFIQQILEQPAAKAALSGEPEQVTRLRHALSQWLRTLFEGRYDATYWQSRQHIGHTHVRAGIPQHTVFVAMQMLWDGLERDIRSLGLPNATARLGSLHKLLMLELSVIMASYTDSYAEYVRQTEREAVEERLTEAKHLAQIGQLAASLAHEIKNPLAGISGAIEVIRDSMKPDAQHRPILDEVLRQISRLDGTVKDLLVYARPKPPSFRKCDLEEIVARTLTVLREEPELQRVSLKHVNSHMLPTIEADENQIEQLLTNLLLNAAQASPDDGLVRLTTATQPDGVRVIVEDRGNGMDPRICQRAMEPFFTTKAKGTGLGLPICRKIAETHGGRITVRSVVGQGTEVIVDLPRQQATS
ncbi:MAG: ATP-binding protein [Planctomycetota bacterium]